MGVDADVLGVEQSNGPVGQLLWPARGTLSKLTAPTHLPVVSSNTPYYYSSFACRESRHLQVCGASGPPSWLPFPQPLPLIHFVGGSPVSRDLALCVGQASSMMSARAMTASRTIEMAAPRVMARLAAGI